MEPIKIFITIATFSLIVKFWLKNLRIREQSKLYKDALELAFSSKAKSLDLIEVYDDLALKGLKTLWILGLACVPYALALLTLKTMTFSLEYSLILAGIPYLFAFANNSKK